MDDKQMQGGGTGMPGGDMPAGGTGSDMPASGGMDDKPMDDNMPAGGGGMDKPMEGEEKKDEGMGMGGGDSGMGSTPPAAPSAS